jgi:3-oxoacyl-[acyl-carrier-protein] synthase II
MKEGEDPRLECVSVLSVGAVSAFGIGAEAYRAAVPGKPARVALRRDEALAAAGFLRPIAARAPADLPPTTTLGGPVFEDRATALLACAMDQVLRGLDQARPGWRGERLGIAMGTSSGGMITAERFFAARAAREQAAREQAAADAVASTLAEGDRAAASAVAASIPDDLARFARGATYFAPMDDVLGAAGLAHVPRRTLILAACAASTIAIGFGLRWLDRGACDLVIAGGFDGLSVFVAAGFEALRATTATTPRPFRKGRDGMGLGEGAGLVALVRRGDQRGVRAHVFVTGFGASTDAVHITAPDATGGGLARAAVAALRDAGQITAELVSAHGTATPFNDAMEAKAIAAAVPGGPVVHPFKAQIGHTLGAAGVLETLAAADALAHQIVPAAAGDGEMDPDADVTLFARSEPRPMARALKLSAAFGGANAAVVLSVAGDRPRPARPRRRVLVAAGAHVTEADLARLSESTGVPRDRLARLDALCRLGLAAASALAARVGKETLAGAGIVAGHGLATLDTNELFDAKKRARGPAGVEPRAFPATSPNAVAGECAIVFKLTGPSFATGAGLDGGTEALLGAAELIAAGDADRMVVVAADDAGPAARDLLAAAGLEARPLARGAVALLLTTDGPGAPIDLDAAPHHDAGPIGHLALLPRIPA